MTCFRGGSLLAAAAFLAACGGPFDSAQDDNQRAQDARALAIPHFAQRPIHPDRGRSSMSPNATVSKALLYIGDDSTNDVYVYDYRSGTPVGTLTGFDGPYGECVDAKGDIYVANFDAGNAVEYAHAGTAPVQTFSPGGTPIGCSVDSKGDVAVTGFDPGQVTVYARGNPKKGTTYTESSSTYFWTMGYDDKGDLVGGGETSSVTQYIFGLLAGEKKMTLLSTSGITIDFLGGATWDGKYFALGDQEAGGTFQTGLVRATLKGTTLHYVSETTLSDDCYNDYTDVVNPFFVGKTNTLFKGKQAKAVIGPNLWCPDGGKSKVDYWHYPGGGLPYKDLSGASSEPYGAAVSLAK